MISRGDEDGAAPNGGAQVAGGRDELRGPPNARWRHAVEFILGKTALIDLDLDARHVPTAAPDGDRVRELVQENGEQLEWLYPDAVPQQIARKEVARDSEQEEPLLVVAARYTRGDRGQYVERRQTGRKSLGRARHG
jgi:hypothetical protein